MHPVFTHTHARTMFKKLSRKVQSFVSQINIYTPLFHNSGTRLGSKCYVFIKWQRTTHYCKYIILQYYNKELATILTLNAKYVVKEWIITHTLITLISDPS